MRGTKSARIFLKGMRMQFNAFGALCRVVSRVGMASYPVSHKKLEERNKH